MNEEQKKSSNIPTILWLVFFFPVGLYFLWAKTNWDKKVKWAITAFYGFIILLYSIGNANSPKTTSSTVTNVATQPPQSAPTATSIPTTPKPTKPPTPTPTSVPKDANGFPMDAETVTVANLDKSPSTYEGKKVTFTCTVAGFAKDSSGNAGAVNCSDPNDSSLVQVDTSLMDNTKINQDDTVWFYGLGGGSATGKNAFGGDVSESLVSGLYINDITSGYSNTK